MRRDKNYLLIVKLLFVLSGLMWPILSQATLIDFDDLDYYYPEPDEEYDPDANPQNWVRDQYQHLGVIFEGAFLATQEYSNIDFPSPPRAITDFQGPGINIHFTDEVLPNFISFTLSAFLGDRIFIKAYDKDDVLVDEVFTDGWAGTEETSTQYWDNQFVSLTAGNIKTVTVDALYLRRGDILLDELFFTRSQIVPNPGTIALIGAGLFVLLWMPSKKFLL